jgi:flavin reductase (DIM6/NTAB) family NADH-FMN oxidoreductase RutF
MYQNNSKCYEKNMAAAKKAFPLSRVYQLLEPGPVVLVTTAYEGKNNVMAMSWHTMIDFVPPLVGCVISNQNYTFERVVKTKECVINIPEEKLAAKVVKIGNTTGATIDKFTKFQLTSLPPALVQAPLIEECFANLECQVVDMKMADKYNFFILEVVKAWITLSKKRQRMIHHCGMGRFVIDGKQITLPSKKK